MKIISIAIFLFLSLCENSEKVDLNKRMDVVIDYILKDTNVVNYIMEKEDNKALCIFVDSISKIKLYSFYAKFEFINKYNILSWSDTIPRKLKHKLLREREKERELNYVSWYYNNNNTIFGPSNCSNKNLHLSWDYDEENSLIMVDLSSIFYDNSRFLAYLFVFDKLKIRAVSILEGNSP